MRLTLGVGAQQNGGVGAKQRHWRLMCLSRGGSPLEGSDPICRSSRVRISFVIAIRESAYSIYMHVCVCSVPSPITLMTS